MATPQLEGLTGIEELGRNQLVVGYRAYRQGRELALEVLHRRQPGDLAEFFRCSALQTRLQHPGMPAVLETGHCESGPYRIREFVRGRPVTDLFGDGPLPPARLVVMARSLLSTLAAIHRRGYVHADLTPEGLRVDRAGMFRFLDVGRGLAHDSPVPSDGRSQALLYAAPEFASGSPARASLDIYSLGAILLSLARGRPPGGRGWEERQAQALSPALRAILAAMLEADPERRPSAAALEASLARLEELEASLRLDPSRAVVPESSGSGFHAYPLVGRQAELAALTQRWNRARQGHGGRLWLVGPRGSGRDRLLDELRRALPANSLRQLEVADPNQPCLLVEPQPAPENLEQRPWLVVQPAEATPAEGEILTLKPLQAVEVLQLAEHYLGGELQPELRKVLQQPGPVYPGELLARLDEWCASGRLRPHWGSWKLAEQKVPAAALSPEPVSAELKPERDYSHELQLMVEFWPLALEQDDPLASYLRRLGAILEARRCQLFAVEADEPSLLATSSGGVVGLPEALKLRAVQEAEPAWDRQHLALPLRCAGRVVGLVLLHWWPEHRPRPGPGLFQLLRVATAPLTLMLSRSAPSDERFLQRLNRGLEPLARSSPDPAQLLDSLLDSLEEVVPSQAACAWLAEPSEVMVARPAGFGPCQQLREKISSARPVQCGKDSLLLSLADGSQLLGGVELRRELAQGFVEAEQRLVALLGRIYSNLLRNARLYGEQSHLLSVTRYRFLAAQIRPHFLFNALNTLAALAVEDPERTEELILDVAEFLRLTFSDRPELVTVAEELRFLDIYWRLEKARFGEGLRLRLEVDPGARQLKMPVLVLQPLVENAIRHGLSLRSELGTVRLSIAAQKQGFEVRIEDDGVGFDTDEIRPTGTGVGLANVRERLEKHYGDQLDWLLTSRLGEGTAISFRIF